MTAMCSYDLGLEMTTLWCHQPWLENPLIALIVNGGFKNRKITDGWLEHLLIMNGGFKNRKNHW